MRDTITVGPLDISFISGGCVMFMKLLLVPGCWQINFRFEKTETQPLCRWHSIDKESILVLLHRREMLGFKSEDIIFKSNL